MRTVVTLPVGMLQTNCYLYYDDETKDAVVIDVGDEGGNVAKIIEAYDVHVRAVLLTHGHYDHTSGVGDFLKKFDVPVYIHEDEVALAASPALNCSDRGIAPRTSITPTNTFKDGETLSFGSLLFTTIHTPGHTAGGSCFYDEEGELIFVGDTLFYHSVGRTDMPTGDHRALIESIVEKLFVLPEETRVYSGHGQATFIGEEISNNPFIN